MICSLAEVLTLCGLSASATEAQLALASMLNVLADRAIKDELQNEVEQAQHVHFHPANDTGPQLDDLLAADVTVRSTTVSLGPRSRRRDVTQLRNTPVLVAGLEVREQTGAMFGQLAGSFGSSTVLTAGTNYYLQTLDGTTSLTGHLVRVGGWPTEQGSVKVTYTGGYTRAQLDGGIATSIKHAAILTTVKAYKQAVVLQAGESGPVISESLGHYSRTHDATTAAMMAGLTVSVPQEAVLLLQKHRHYGRLFG